MIYPSEYPQSQVQGWSVPINISNSEDNSINASLASDLSGKVHIIWVEDSVNELPAIFYSQFSDDIWTNPIDIISSENNLRISFPQLVIDSQNILHIIYMENGLLYNNSDSTLAASAKSWSNPETLFQATYYLSHPFIAIGSDDSIYIVFAIQVGYDSGILFLSSKDRGLNWTNPTYIYENNSLNLLIDKPVIAVDLEGKLHVAWQESEYPETFPPIGINYINSSDGTNWSEPIILADGPYADPKIFTTSNNQIHIVWSGTGDDRHKFHTWSTNGGKNWHEIWRNSALGGTQGYPALVEDSSGRIYWLQVGTVFSLPQVSGTNNDCLYLNIFSDGFWSTGEVLLRSSIPEQNMGNVSSTISLGNQLHVVVQNPLRKPDGQYQFDVFYLNKYLDSAQFLPIQPEYVQTRNTQISIPSSTPSPIKTSLSFPTSNPSVVQPSTGIISISAIASAILIIVVVLLILYRRN